MGRSKASEIVPKWLIENLAKIGIQQAIGVATNNLTQFDASRITSNRGTKMEEPLTGKQLRDRYDLMTGNQKKEFLRLLGKVSPAEAPFAIANELSCSERKRFSDMIFDELTSLMIPMLIENAIQIVKEDPNGDRTSMTEKLLSSVSEKQRMYDENQRALHYGEFKSERDRKPDPEIVRRNVEICDLRKSDSKHWTQGQLAKRYGVTSPNIRLILRDEDGWRRKLAELGDE